MSLEELIIGHNILMDLEEAQLVQLLDLLDDPLQPLSSTVLAALKRVHGELEDHFGPDHPAIQELRAALQVNS
jgi:hypothetical protein